MSLEHAMFTVAATNLYSGVLQFLSGIRVHACVN